MKNKKRELHTCPFCGNNDGNILVEYWGGDKNIAKYHYDGVSEGQCRACRSRWNRWTLEKLEDDEVAYFEKNVKVPEGSRIGLLFKDESEEK